MDYTKEYSQPTQSMKSSLIRELVASTRNIPGLISFAGGFPSPSTFPKDILSDLYSRVIIEEGMEVLQYGASEGDRQLKEELIKWEGYRGLTPEEMLITVGATNGIYYYAKTFINPGDVILCEAPSFLGSLVTFEAIGAEVHGIDMNGEGIDLEKLQSKITELRAAGKNIKFLYTIPDFQNPSGISMTLQRRKDLISLCEASQLPIMEDNPYSRLRFLNKPIATLYAIARKDFNNSNLVTEIVSFSKILGPGMRLAFVKGPADVISKMESWQQKINVTPDCVTQRVATRFLEKGFMTPHIKTICEFYKPFLNKMLSELDKNMPSCVTWTKPEGGIFVWLWLPENMSADELFVKAKDHKVTFIPGSKFYPTGQEKVNCLRLNFTFSSMQQIEEGIGRLGELIRSQID
ncbi:MAG: PLP-dependent aminotransferase family protein [Candidatus Cloacimonetes bacterium HGW-Cloacimonetes-1]|jgi:2-aminoadipate transaminase|nr:MAG: PLP-dependent aminotransferase family protein [Candidatus Cloacimonetes bacterium HGW-Cloacimonetes-1]